MRFFLALCTVIVVTGAWLNGTGKKRPAKVDPGLVELIDKIDAKSETIESIRAKFVQRKEISLLKEPVEMKGVFLLKRPDGIRFDFEPKEDLSLVMTKEEMISVSHGAKKASRIPFKKRRSELAQRILSDKLAVMLGYFTVTRASSAENGEQRLELAPSKRKLKKRFRDIQIWVNPDYLIYRVRVTLKDGDVYDLTLTDIEENIDLVPQLFDTEIPGHYETSDRMEFIFGSGVTF